MLDVSGAAEAPAAACPSPAREFAPGAGDPSGVVDSMSMQLTINDQIVYKANT
jgi:hypothetical protein